MPKKRPTTPSSAAELLQADPSELTLAPNVRLDTSHLDKAFVASVAERGVLEPIVAYRDGDGTLMVLLGSRRALAAARAGRATVPVWVVRQPADADRLVDQLAENTHRQAITTAERVVAYQQLAAIGLTPAQIAKRASVDRDEVDAGLAVSRSARASEELTRHESLTIEQAAAVAEFDGDDDATTRLLGAAERGVGFHHQLQWLRDRRDERRDLAAAAQQWRDQGVTVVDPPSAGAGSTMAELAELLNDGGEPLTEDGHRSCPGHAAFIDCHWSDDDPDDEAGDDEDEAEPVRVFEPVWVCLDPAGHGHAQRGAGAAGPVGKTEADQEAEKAARRELAEATKAWKAAQAVRLSWVAGLCRRKTPPKGAAAFVALSLAEPGFWWVHALTDGGQMVREALGLDPADDGRQARRGEAVAGVLAGASEARAQVVTLGLVLAAHEYALRKRSWPDPAEPQAAAYLRFLADLGYELSEMERRVLLTKESDG